MTKDLLGDEVAKPKRAKAPPVPHPPETCSVSGCNAGTDVIVLLVRRIADGKQLAGRPGAFINVANNGEWTMRKGFAFDSWVTRCGKHYGQDLERYNAQR